MSLLKEMSGALQLPERLVLGISHKADHAYYSFRVPKRSGGTRVINHPSRELKALQRWLLYAVIEGWPVHAAAFAYRPGKNIGHHAAQHASSDFLVRLDLRSFFPSISAEDIRSFIDRRPPGTDQWRDEDFQLFCRVVCRRGQLTIGAPSSPALSNSLCFQLDQELTNVAADVGATYTRYADDLFFSTRTRDVLWDLPDKVTEVLQGLPVPAGLSLNAEKTRHSSKKGRRQVTGLVITPDGEVKIGRRRKRFIRRQVHELDTLPPEARRELAGLIAFAIDIEPDFLNALVLKYGPDRVERARGLRG